MVASADNMGAKDAPWTVETLIGAAERIIASDPQLFAHPESENKKDLNVRLIRDYVVREFIPRPERVGREARFGLNHLVQLLAVRVLLRSQKWSLPAIKASFVTGDNRKVRPERELDARQAENCDLTSASIGEQADGRQPRSRGARSRKSVKIAEEEP